ncbi:MAG: hypothetical protein Q9160_001802 [Pyrenula sp. 1 TL-2023]
MSIQQPISIIGAGIGGLALSRCLLRRGIPSVLYERASSPTRHRYGITLHEWAYRPLLKVLEMDEDVFKKRTAVTGETEADVNHQTGSNAMDPPKLGDRGKAGSCRAHRAKLEDLLREGLDIRWNHGLERLELDRTGVILHMQEGQSIERSCVVGADGVHANSRRSILPDIKPTILPFVAFNGKRWIPKQIFGALYLPALNGSFKLERRKNNARLHISINEIYGDSVSINWIYSRAAQEPSDPLFKPNRPLTGATDIPEKFYQEIRGLIDLSQPFADVFDEDKLRKEKVLSWLMRTVEIPLPELQRLAEKGVFLMGDSLHAQPILGGEGANVAIMDGIELADHIANNGIKGMSNWYRNKYLSWSDGVERSREAIREMHI